MEKYMPFIWIGFAVLMAICEAATTQLVSIWFVVGAIAAAISTLFTPSIFIQLIVFLVVSTLTLLITRPLVKKLRRKSEKTSTNADRLIGDIGVVIREIASAQSVGQVKIRGEIWSAVSKQTPVQADERVKIVSIEGVKLLVEPIKEGADK